MQCILHVCIFNFYNAVLYLKMYNNKPSKVFIILSNIWYIIKDYIKKV